MRDQSPRGRRQRGAGPGRGEPHDDRRAAPHGGLHVDAPIVVGDDAVDDRQAEPGAAAERAAERVEDGVDFLGRDAGALVAHADLRLPVLGGDEQLQPPAVGHRLEAVGGQVPDDLPQLVLVGVDPHRIRRHLDLDDVVVGGLGALAQQRGGVLDRPAGVDPGELHPPGPGVGQERRDGRVQPIRLAQHDVHQRGLLGRQRQLAAQHLHRARHRGQRVADLVGDAGGHLAHRRQPLPHLRGAFQALDVGDVLEREDDAALAARPAAAARRSRPGRCPGRRGGGRCSRRGGAGRRRCRSASSAANSAGSCNAAAAGSPVTGRVPAGDDRRRRGSRSAPGRRRPWSSGRWPGGR